MEKSPLKELHFFEVKKSERFSFKSSKNYRLFWKRVIVFSIIAALQFTGFPTTAYAKATFAVNTEAKKEQRSTLTTEIEKTNAISFTGEGHGVNSIIPAMADLQASNTSAGFEAGAKVRKLAKADYRPNEEINIVIENGAHKNYKTELIDAVGNKVALETEVVETGASKVITIEQPSSFRPGKYTLRISDGRGGVSEQDFSWGVLAVNPDKSIYAPNETANLSIGVLDEGGDMVCDAQVELQITAPGGNSTSLSTDNGKIIVNEECKSHEFTLKPDYETTYQTGGPGVYKMILKSQTKNGSYSISDSFEVRNSVAFDVKRISATRIYPPNTYPVTLEITANQDFEGTVSETVPGNFKIARPGEEIKSDTDKVDALVAAQEASDSADIIAPDSLPKRPAPVIPTDNVIAYSTINTVGDFDGGKAVLGASVPGLGMPFSGLYPITQEFGESLVYDQYGHELYDSFGMHGHDGIDFAMPIGTPLLAVDAGQVILAGAGDYGTTIVIQHSWGRSYYGHLSEVGVKSGDSVERGATIGRSGNTGHSTGPHLHFGIKPDKNDSKNGYYGKVDPAYYLGMKQSATAVLGAATKFDDSINAAPSTDVQILTWKINVKKGDKIRIGYNYLAPRISPQFYTLGPATFTDTKTGKEVFHEIRKWQIASDALDFKFKRGTFTKSNCTATCTQTVGGVGFKPKAIIFEWSTNTAEGFAQHQVTGMGFATSPTEERSISYCSEDNVGTSDTRKARSTTKVITIHNTDCSNASALVAQADFVSFDSDGFTLSWTANNSSQYIIHYTAIGGADVSNVKVGSFTLSSSGATQSFTDPGFQPDFMMFLANGGGAIDSSDATASISAGFAAGPSKEAGMAMVSRSGQTTQDSFSVQRTDSSIVLLSGSTANGALDAVADVSSFDATGFTLNVTDTPLQSTPIYYLAIKGGQYDVGAFNQPAANGPQSIYTGFRPSGVITLAASQSATSSITQTATFSTGGASRDSSTPWCDDKTGVRCTLPDTQLDASNDWCNDTTGITCTSDWSTRKKITINASSSANLTNFPVLVKLDSSRIDYAKTQGSGQDIRFVDPSDNTTVLSHEIETWNESGSSYVWVKVPQLDAGAADYIWMYYGNASASDGQDATNVWDSSTKGVWHLDEDPAGSAPQMSDSTGINNGTTSGMVASDSRDSQISKGLNFDASNNFVDASNNSSLNNTTNTMTISAWVRRGTTSATGYIVTRGTVGTNGYGLGIGNNDSSTCGTNVLQVSKFGVVHACVGAVPADTNWHHVTAVMSSTGIVAFIDGASSTPTNSNTTSMVTSTTSFRLGTNASGASLFNGQIDEVRVVNTNRSVDWIRAEYLSGSDRMNTFGTEQSYSEIQSTDGWTARKKITFNNINSGEDLDNFPVLVMLNSSKIDYSKTQDSGQDIRFVDPSDPNTVLSHEIEQWNESGTSYVWVKVPRINKQSNTDHIWMYYGNPSASDGQDPASVWNGNFRGVWHTKETSGTTISDSTSNNNKGELLNGAAVTSSGKIGYANNFDGTNDLMRASSSGSLNNLRLQGGAGFTASAWINTDTSVDSTFGQIAMKAAAAAPTTGWVFEIIGTGNLLGYFQTSSTSNTQRVSSSTFSDTTWTYVTLTHAGSNTASEAKMYINGTEVSYSTTTNGSGTIHDDAAQYFTSGCDAQASSGECFDGKIDELRISNVIRSADWIEAEYLNMNDTMNIFGPEETLGSTTQTYSQGSIWSDDLDNQNTPVSNANSISDTTRVVRFAASPTGGTNPRTVAAASFQSFDPTGFTVNWTDTDSTSRLVLYWAAGSVTASQEDYRWYKNADAATPTTALEDENSSTIIAKNKPYVRLRSNISTGGNGLNASTQGFKLQYAANQAEVSVGGTSDWCSDATGSVTCTSPTQAGEQAPSNNADWCNDTTGVTCNADWSVRRKITFNNASSSAALTDFPVLIKLDSTRINYNKVQSDGDDLRFVDPSDPTTVLNHEIEGTWTSGGTNYVWVKVTQIDARSTADYIWMYYGNASASSPATELGNSTHATGVWDSNYKAVYHMHESSGSTNTDSTTNGLVGNKKAATEPNPAATGVVGAGQDFDGSNDYVRTTDTNALDLSTNGTVSVMFNRDGIGAFHSLIAKGDSNSGPAHNYAMEFDTTNILIFTIGNGVSSQDAKTTSSVTSTTADYMATGTWDGSNVRVFLNGIQNGSAGQTVTPAANTATLHFGEFGGNVDYFNGVLDEIRISNIARSADWLRAEYLSNTDQMNTYGTEITLQDVQQSSSGWQYRRKITFNNASASGTLTNVPVLVELDASTVDYNKTQDDGGDIRFVDPSDKTTALSHEIESWNENGTSYVWVEVPSIAAGAADYIWMYYGNPSVADGQDAAGVWDSNGRGVYHFAEGTGTNANDSSLTNDLTLNPASWSTNTKIYGGWNGTGSNWASITDDPDLDFGTGSFSISVWAKSDSVTNPGTNEYIVDKEAGTGYAVYFNTSGQIVFGIDSDGTWTPNDTATSTADYYDTAWHHIVAVKNGTSSIQLFVDGTLVGTDASITASTLDNSDSLTVGSQNTVNDTDDFNGDVDELQILSTNLSTDEVEARYLSQTGLMNGFGEEQAYAISGTNTIGWRDVADIWCNDATGVTCNTNWKYRKRITINNQSSSTALTDFPVLVKLDASRIDYGKIQDAGQDLRFVDPSNPNVAIPHEIEVWNEAGESFVWVQVDLPANSTTNVIWMYYGNPSASSPATELGNGTHASDVWGTDYELVQHLEETSACSTTFTDSTVNANNGTCGGSPIYHGNGPVDGARDFSGGDQYVRVEDSNSLDLSTDGTWEAWINADTFSTNPSVIQKDRAIAVGGTEDGYSLGLTSANKFNMYVVNPAGTSANIISTTSLSTQTWYHIVAVKSGTTMTMYLNGVSDGSGTVPATIEVNGEALGLGIRVGDTLEDYDGRMDEARVSSIARSADWIKATFLTESDQMNTFGNEETQTSAVWRFKDNSSVTDRGQITSALLGTSASGSQLTFQESNITALNPAAIAAGEKREFDFSLDGSLASNRRTYFFRIVNADGTPLTSYTRYPSITVGVPNQKVMRGGKFFNYKTTQPFTF